MLAVLSVLVGVIQVEGDGGLIALLIDFALAVAVTFGFWYGLIWVGGRIVERFQR